MTVRSFYLEGSCLLLAFLAVVTNNAAAAVVSPAFYVSPTGSDSNTGQSLGSPFLTLEKAQSAMQKSTTKTTYLLSGTFARSAALKLVEADAGESWLAYPGDTPILDGKDSTDEGIEIGGNNITVRWLTIQSFEQDGISAAFVSGSVIDSNIIKDIHSGKFSEGAILLSAAVSNMTVTHNSIYDVAYSGIEVVNGNNTISSINIEFNLISKTCQNVNDCGAIYADNPTHKASGILIRNNVINGYGLETKLNASKGIYLDDQLSNATVESNIIYGPGTSGLEIHGGDHNTFQNNIFDISDSFYNLGLYQYEGTTETNFGMANNVFTCNIVYSSSSAAPATLWAETIVAGTDSPPSVHSNVYWGAAQNDEESGGPIVDTAPIFGTEDFVNPAAGNYNFTSGPPTGCGFTAIDTSTVGPLPNN